MRVQNRTRCRTEDLARFFRAGLKAVGADPAVATIVVCQQPTASRSCGRAAIDGHWIRMNVPAQGLGDRDALTGFAQVFEHEVAHNLGLRHEDMDEDLRACRGDLPAWAEGLAIALKPETPAAPTPSREERLAQRIARRAEHAQAMLARWRKKLDAAERQYRRWSRKVGYYHRRGTAAGEGGN